MSPLIPDKLPIFRPFLDKISICPLSFINIEYFNESDLIVTLCGDVLDKCPMIPKEINHEHWNLEDPARALGTEVEILEKFRKTRDLIKEQVKLIGK